MARIYRHEESEEWLEFARKAANFFKESDTWATFTEDGEVEAGQLFAVRWGVAGQAVLVFRLDEFTEPIIYPEMGCEHSEEHLLRIKEAHRGKD
jgi:hypothetical protein